MLLVSLLSSCGKTEEDIKEEKQKAIEQKESELRSSNENNITKLVTKNHAVRDWDTLLPYTYVYQNMFIEENKPITFEGVIKDITKNGLNYVLKVHSMHRRRHRNYDAEISVSAEHFQGIEKLLKSNGRIDKGCFIFKVSKIISVSPEIKSEIEWNGEDSYSFLTYDFQETLLIFKGELLDFYLNQRIADASE
jgi:hypothetical protein